MTERDPTAGPAAHAPAPMAGESNSDYRARIAHHQADLRERRQHELQQQASTLNTPTARIRIWERLHQLSLPRDPKHRLLAIIAANTGLTLAEVQGEQKLRLASPVADQPAA